MIPNRFTSPPQLPPSVPPHLAGVRNSENGLPVAEFAEASHSIEPLNESDRSPIDLIVIGIGTTVWYFVALREITKTGGASSQIIKIAFQVLFTFAAVSFSAWIPVLMGLGTLRAWLRYAIGCAVSIPIVVIVAMDGPSSSARTPELMLRVMVWLVTVSSIFWVFRLFRWRITHAKKLILSSDDGKNEEVLIPLDQSDDDAIAVVRWHLYLRSSPHKFLDRFRPDQFNIRQVMLVTFVIGASIAVAKFIDQSIEVFSFQGQPMIQVLLPLIIYAFATLVVAWSILRPQNVLRYYFACMGLIFCTIFIIVFLTTTRGIVNLEADFYQTLQVGSMIEMVFSFGCLWLMILRCLGFRLIRVAPSGFSSEN